MTHIVAAATALPEHRYAQGEITEALLPLVVAPVTVGAGVAAGAGGSDESDPVATLPASDRPPAVGVVRRIHAASGVQTRHLAMPLDFYTNPLTFGEANDVFASVGARLATRAVMDALAAAGLDGCDVDFMFFTTVTGVSAPSLDAALVASCGLRPDVKRMPSFGLGCAGGAAGLARVHDYLVGHPAEVGLLVSVELCSLTLQHDDPSTANVVASGLFGDGAAAVVLTGDDRALPESTRNRVDAIAPGRHASRWNIDHSMTEVGHSGTEVGHAGTEVGHAGPKSQPAPRILDTVSTLVPDTERALGWDVGGDGFRIVLGVDVPDIVERHVASGIEAMLAGHGLGVDDVGVWLAHPGGPKVLDAMSRALRLAPGALQRSWDSLAQVGNLSSASVLHILTGALDEPRQPGEFGVLFAVGPGVTAEAVLLQWGAA